MAQAAAQYAGNNSSVEDSASNPSGEVTGAAPTWNAGTDGRIYGNIQDAAREMGVKPSEVSAMGTPHLPGIMGLLQSGVGWLQDHGLPGYAMSPEERAAGGGSYGSSGNHSGLGAATQVAGTPAQTTDAKKVEAATSAGVPTYTWDPVLGRYTMTHAGSGSAAIGRQEGDVLQQYAAPAVPQSGVRAFAAGGPAGGLHAAASLPPRFVRGPGDGQSDDIPVSMSDGGMGHLADNEFVIPADAVSALGSGSSEAGARALYDMVDRIRHTAHGHTAQAKPVTPGKVMPV